MNGGVRNEEDSGRKNSRMTVATENLRIDVPGLGSVVSGRLCEGDKASCISLFARKQVVEKRENLTNVRNVSTLPDRDNK